MAILANQKILTLDWWKRADQLQPGDIVFDRQGKPVEVKLVQDCRPEVCYEVLFNDHLTVGGDHNLGFLLEDKTYRHKEVCYQGKRTPTIKLRPKRLSEIADEPLKRQDKFGKTKYSIPTTQPIQLPAQDLPVPAFVFGFWIMNRRPARHFWVQDEYRETLETLFKDHGYKTKFQGQSNRFTIAPTIESQLAPNIPRFIPNNYLMGSAEQRLQLFRGIIHGKTRTYNEKTDVFRISTTSWPLIKQIQWLAESLGHKTQLSQHYILKHYSLVFKSKLPLVQNQRSKPIKWVMARRFIKEINEIQGQPCVTIETKGEDNTILVGEGFIACR